MTTKLCARCHEEKPLVEFWAEKQSSDGRQSYCKSCCMAKGREWRVANPEKAEAAKERQRTRKLTARAAWLEANKDAITKPIKTPEEWSQ